MVLPWLCRGDAAHRVDGRQDKKGGQEHRAAILEEDAEKTQDIGGTSEEDRGQREYESRPLFAQGLRQAWRQH